VRLRPRAGLSPASKTWLALGTIYVVWGSTYLAIRVAIETIPPLLMAATRFLLAGGVLYAWAIRRGDVDGDRPRRPQWRAAFIVGGLLFLGGNGGVALAEGRIPSGITALLVATIPLWFAVISRAVLHQRLSPRVVAGLALGFAGTAVLARPSGLHHLDLLGVAIALGAAVCWASGSLSMRELPLPRRRTVSTAMQMLAGGSLMAGVGILRGELGRLHPSHVSLGSALALLYLIVFGSLVAFTTYTWLLSTASVSLISTYPFVNPVVALFLGWLFLSEPISAQTLVASGSIVAAVAIIASAQARVTRPNAPPPTAQPNAP
jgi:drug/metabolite transporter (DMT)-like permease